MGCGLASMSTISGVRGDMVRDVSDVLRCPKCYSECAGD